MYALIGDVVETHGFDHCVVISYDDDADEYLVWNRDTQIYVRCPQEYVKRVDRWERWQNSVVVDRDRWGHLRKGSTVVYAERVVL